MVVTQEYDLRRPKPPRDAYVFYRRYVKAAAAASGLILEPMCGSGRFLLPLLAERFDVHGFDASQPMLDLLLAKARQRKPELKPKVPAQYALERRLLRENRAVKNVWLGRVEELSRPERYKLIFIPNGSFCLLDGQSVVESALRALHEHLADDGVLVFECDTLAAVPTLGTWPKSRRRLANGQTIIVSRHCELEGNVCSFNCQYELFHVKQLIQTEAELLRFRLYDPRELMALLRAAGFRSIRVMPAFDQTAQATAEDEVVVFEARKL